MGETSYCSLRELLEYEYVRDRFRRHRRISDGDLGLIYKQLLKDGKVDLAEFFTRDYEGGYEQGSEAVGHLGLDQEDARLLIEILKSLEQERSGRLSVWDIVPAQQGSVSSEVVNPSASTREDDMWEVSGGATQAFEPARVQDAPKGGREELVRPCGSELEKECSGIRARIAALEKERDALVARCKKCQDTEGALERVVAAREAELRRVEAQRDELREACEGLTRQIAQADGVWDVLSGATIGLPSDRVLRVVEEFGAGNLCNGADHSVLLALLVVVCREGVEDTRFVERFTFLEGEIEFACAGDAARRDRLRGFVGPILASRLSHWRIDWALTGKSFDSRISVPVSDSGTRIVEVLSAALWRDGECVRKARVRTL